MRALGYGKKILFHQNHLKDYLLREWYVMRPIGMKTINDSPDEVFQKMEKIF